MLTSCKRWMAAVGGLLWACLAGVHADAPKDRGFVERLFKGADGEESKYVLFVPHGYNGEQPCPVILFLHGAGEREGGKKAPVEVGMGPAIKKYGEEKFPFFVVIP